MEVKTIDTKRLRKAITTLGFVASEYELHGLDEALPALLDLAERYEAAPEGEAIEIGNDDEGQPRALIHSTREELRKGPPLAFRRIRLVRTTGESE